MAGPADTETASQRIDDCMLARELKQLGPAHCNPQKLHCCNTCSKDVEEKRPKHMVPVCRKYQVEVRSWCEEHKYMAQSNCIVS